MPDFGERLEAVFAQSGRLCVGIDPHSFLLEQWGLPDTAEGTREFGLRVVDAADGTVGILKPQVAFFERHGSAGFAALEDVLTAARAASMLVIGDAKRGDIGTSVEAYGQAWLTPGSPLEVDAVTLAAYQGVGSIAAPIALAQANGKGVFVLAATSNPEAAEVQTAVLSRGPFDGRTVAAGIIAEVDAINAEEPGLGSVGVVIGATIELIDYGISVGELLDTPILGPGFGEQGAAFADLSSIYGLAAKNVIVTVSRSVLRAGPAGIAAEIEKQAAELAEATA
ncbi:MAG: orotidine-5'-phosphate decarboxylase [Salinibacterium sp.]|nr:MAG: orotidine-5'-phosphate decarboxylase [Salinibacterium sp.]